MDDEETPTLSCTAISALQEFYAERTAREETFQKLKHEAEVAADSVDILSMDLFVESWQDSQFWYSEETANILATALLGDADEKETVAMVSAPSAYVMARRILKQSGRPKDKWPRLLLLEYDIRFEIFKDDFIFYDYNKPLSLPPWLKGAVDHIICDPPFLSDDCQTKAAMTVRWISKCHKKDSEWEVENSRLIVCTGERMENAILELYQQQSIARTSLEPVHSKQQLSNEFLCFANFESDFWALKRKPLQKKDDV